MAELWPLPSDPLDGEVDEAARSLHLAEKYAEYDRTPAFPHAEFRGLGARGLLGLTIPSDHGGRNLPAGRAGAVLFHLAYLGGTTFAKLALQPEFCSVLLRRGAPELVREWFDPIVRGERLVGNQVTEPSAGSDARAIALRASRDGDAYRLSGTKSEAAFASEARAAIVYGKLATPGGPEGITAFLVPQDLAGVTSQVDAVDMGERWQRRGRVRYDEVRVPRTFRLGEEGEGFAPLLEELVRERGLLACIYLGVARASLDETVAHVGEREAFGRRLADNQAVALPLVEAATDLHGAWLVASDALARLDRGLPALAQTALAKARATTVALRSLDLGVQFHGGAGYSSRLRHEQRYRDVRSGPIAHGSTEVLRQSAARSLWPAARSH